jgi:hypothetical protein
MLSINYQMIVTLFLWLFMFFGIIGCLLGSWFIFAASKPKNSSLEVRKGQIKILSGLFMLSFSILGQLFFDYVADNYWIIVIFCFLVIPLELIPTLYFNKQLKQIS